MSILVVGSVAYDTVETAARAARTPAGRQRQLLRPGGPGQGRRCAAWASSATISARPTWICWRRAAPTSAGIARVPGQSFHWSGRYHADMIERDTLATELGVFADFQPEMPAGWRGQRVPLPGQHPSLAAAAGAGGHARAAPGGPGHHEPVDRDHPRGPAEGAGPGRRAAGQRQRGPAADGQAQPGPRGARRSRPWARPGSSSRRASTGPSSSGPRACCRCRR